ncbi:hypothetical protein SCHPADRAFT_933330 [Schizopora paradoxa]|uniref:Uncharacterized protein n=1 Tax=Schizopora paradoxa TaxID=27342 RepID=A0A0H2R2L0_9AGAM|nr:hypothetical protein SCHPADRAFT_933330 [Schizopora paradoxa]
MVTMERQHQEHPIYRPSEIDDWNNGTNELYTFISDIHHQESADLPSIEVPNFKIILPSTPSKRAISNVRRGDAIPKQTKLRRIQSSLEIAKPNTSPISSLFPDVLREIFEHGCSTTGSLVITFDGIAVPTLVFSQVCRSWRSLILSHSSLWSSLIWGTQDEDLHVDSRFFLPAAAKRLVQLWDLYLSRSRQALLDITLHLYEDDEAEIREHLLNCVFEQLHRITNLELYCDDNAIPHEKEYIINAAPRLKILKLLAPTRYDDDPPQPLRGSVTVDTSSLSILQELSAQGNVLLEQVGISNSLQSVAYYPENFINVDTSVAFPSSTSGFLSLLHCVPNIREMKFDIELPTIPKNSPQHLPLHHLSKLALRMRTEGSETMDYLLGILDIPALEKLELLFYGRSDGDRRWHWKNGAALKSVKDLVLDISSNRYGDRDRDRNMDPIHNENLRSLLLCTPALKSLDICTEWISSKTLSLLTLATLSSENVADNLCPKLEKLSLSEMYTEHVFSYQDIISLISSRFRVREDVEGPKLSGLKEVYIRLGSENSNGVGGPKLKYIEPIRSFIEQGLQLHDAYCNFQP